jgi:predicted AAA+ superfamily ATPase
VVEEYWRNGLPKTVERKIILKTESDLINDIIGPRRAGKTFLMFSTIRALLEGGIRWR